MRTRFALAASTLGLALLVALAPSAAHAATAASALPKPPNIPFIGPDGVSSVGTGTDQRTNPLRDINTGKPTFATPTPRLGWIGAFGMIGLGAGGTVPELTEGMCNDYADNPTLRAHCAPYMTTQGMTAQTGVFGPGAPAFAVPVSHGSFASDRFCYVKTNPATCTTGPFTAEVANPPTHPAGQLQLTIKFSPRAGYTPPTTTPWVRMFWKNLETGQISMASNASFSSAAYALGAAKSSVNFAGWTPYAAGILANNTWNNPHQILDQSDPNTTTQALYWFSEHHPGYVAPEEGVATGIIEVEVECMAGDSSQIIKSTRAVTTRAGQPFAMPEVVCPDGWTAVGTGVGWIPEGGEKQTIIDRTEDQLGPGVRDMVQTQPDCFNGLQECVLELRQLVGGQLLSCGSVGQLCPDWASNPNAPNIYKCYYGGVGVDLNLCSAYRAPHVGVLPNLDKDGNIVPYTAPIPSNLPGSAPGTIPGSGTAPDLRGECAARKAPSFWEGGFSPYWIYEGARCAMIEVFVPRSGVIQAKATQVQAAWLKTPPGLVIDYVETIQEELPDAGGCLGPRVAFTIDLGPIYIPVDAHPLSACENPMAFWASTARTIGALAMLASTAAALTRYVGSVVNAPQLGSS